MTWHLLASTRKLLPKAKQVALLILRTTPTNPSQEQPLPPLLADTALMLIVITNKGGSALSTLRHN